MEEAAREREGCEKMRSKKDGRSKENVIVIVIARFQEEWNLNTDIQMLSSTRFIFREEENPRGLEIVGILINKTNPFSRSKKNSICQLTDNLWIRSMPIGEEREIRWSVEFRLHTLILGDQKEKRWRTWCYAIRGDGIG